MNWRAVSVWMPIGADGMLRSCADRSSDESILMCLGWDELINPNNLAGALCLMCSGWGGLLVLVVVGRGGLSILMIVGPG